MGDRRPHWDDDLILAVKATMRDNPWSAFAVIAVVEDWVLNQPIFDWHVTTKHAQDKAEVERLTAALAESEAARTVAEGHATDLAAELAESERLLEWWVTQGMAFAQAVNRQRDDLADRDRRIEAALALHAVNPHACEHCGPFCETCGHEWPCHTANILRGESDE